MPLHNLGSLFIIHTSFLVQYVYVAFALDELDLRTTLPLFFLARATSPLCLDLLAEVQPSWPPDLLRW